MEERTDEGNDALSEVDDSSCDAEEGESGVNTMLNVASPIAEEEEPINSFLPLRYAAMRWSENEDGDSEEEEVRSNSEEKGS